MTDPPRVLKRKEVAALFRVGVPTVTKWAKTGKINSIRLPSGHRRYPEDEILALLNGEAGPEPEVTP